MVGVDADRAHVLLAIRLHIGTCVVADRAESNVPCEPRESWGRAAPSVLQASLDAGCDDNRRDIGLGTQGSLYGAGDRAVFQETQTVLFPEGRNGIPVRLACRITAEATGPGEAKLIGRFRLASAIERLKTHWMGSSGIQYSTAGRGRRYSLGCCFWHS